MTGPTPTDYVQSLAPGLMLIRVFDAEHPVKRSQRSPALTRATARRFLLTLVELGYVRTDGSVSR